MRPRFLFAPALALGLCAALPAHALTKEDAANNLMLLIGARNDAMFCEPHNKTAIKSLMKWETRHKSVFDRSMRAIEDAAVATGALPRERASEASMLLLARFQGRYDRDVAPTRKPIHCTRFDETLEVYGRDLRTK
ncbi:hypothetical protein [Roseateles sp. L2-2]|uniref:hypothetical protein n=1 Tax=Roseateles TaxID=93681 RepID=UPI003D36EA01